MPGTDHRTGDDAGSTTDATDDAALRSIQFEASGDLSDSTFAALRELDGATLGAAITQLLARAALLEPPQRNIAVAAIERAFTAGTSSAAKVRFDAPKLIEIYRTVMADPSRRDVADLAIRLLATVNRDTIMDSIPIDPAGLDLRVSLDRALDAAAGLDQPVASQPTTRHRLRPVRLGRGSRRGSGAGGGSSADPGHGRGAATEWESGRTSMPSRSQRWPNRRSPRRRLGTNPRTAAGLRRTATGLRRTATSHRRRHPRRRTAHTASSTPATWCWSANPSRSRWGLASDPRRACQVPPMKVRRPDQKPYMLDVQLFADGFDLAPGECVAAVARGGQRRPLPDGRPPPDPARHARRDGRPRDQRDVLDRRRDARAGQAKCPRHQGRSRRRRRRRCRPRPLRARTSRPPPVSPRPT